MLHTIRISADDPTGTKRKKLLVQAAQENGRWAMIEEYRPTTIEVRQYAGGGAFTEAYAAGWVAAIEKAAKWVNEEVE